MKNNTNKGFGWFDPILVEGAGQMVLKDEYININNFAYYK